MSDGRASGGEGAGRAGDAGRDARKGADDTRRLPTLEKEPPPDGTLEQSASAAAYAPGTDGPAARAGRFWSARRLPAGLVAFAVLAAAALFLYDITSVRLNRPGMGWRRTLADELATRPLDDPWLLAGASLAALAGVLLLVLTATPGLRGLLPMRRDVAHVRAGLERGAAELVLRDRAMEVSGVQSVRVNVGRRRVRARARAHFRDLDVVRADLDDALEDGIRKLGLARQPGLSVHVRRPSKKG